MIIHTPLLQKLNVMPILMSKVDKEEAVDAIMLVMVVMVVVDIHL
jgi:hypothetical protein